MEIVRNVCKFGWVNCIVVVYGRLKLLVTADIGPRIIWIGDVDDEIEFDTNVFGGFRAQLGKSGEADFQFRMGFRFWLAPEEAGPKTYDPDNFPVEDVRPSDRDRVLTIVQKTGFDCLQKFLSMNECEDKRDGIWVRQTLVNSGNQTVNGVALWGLCGMAKKGIAIIPRPTFQCHPAFVKPGAGPAQIGGFLSAQNISLWPYTNLQDPRLTLGQKFILLRQDPSVENHNVNKLGLSDVPWVAYLVRTAAGVRLFINRLHYVANNQHNHPDRGMVCELFVCRHFLEIEALGPLGDIVPQAAATQLITRWSVHVIGSRMPKLTDKWIEDNVVPLVGLHG